MTYKAIVIGGSGFIGSHLIDCLIENNCQVLNIDNEWSLFNYQEKSCRTLIISMLSDRFADILEHENKDASVIYHLAGISGIQDCIENSEKAVQVNVAGTIKILEKIKNNKEAFFVFSSSLYADSDVSGIYGITKRVCEDLIKFYHKQYGLNYIIFRIGTVYGSRANHHNSMANLIRSALKTKKISYYGTGEETREYIHVADVAKALVDFAINEKYWNQTYELTGTHPTKAKDMINLIKELLGDEYKVEFRNEKVINHYNVTPMQFKQNIVKKYIPDVCCSLSSGLYSLIKEIANEESS